MVRIVFADLGIQNPQNFCDNLNYIDDKKY
jgi:hypothetical protein